MTEYMLSISTLATQILLQLYKTSLDMFIFCCYEHMAKVRIEKHVFALTACFSAFVAVSTHTKNFENPHSSLKTS